MKLFDLPQSHSLSVLEPGFGSTFLRVLSLCSFERAKKRETSCFRKNEEENILVKEIQPSEILFKYVDF